MLKNLLALAIPGASLSASAQTGTLCPVVRENERSKNLIANQKIAMD